MNAAKKLVTFVKKETVLCIAGLLAVVSMFIIHPSADYFGYIDYRVLAVLFYGSSCGLSQCGTV